MAVMWWIPSRRIVLSSPCPARACHLRAGEASAERPDLGAEAADHPPLGEHPGRRHARRLTWPPGHLDRDRPGELRGGEGRPAPCREAGEVDLAAAGVRPERRRPPEER